MTMFQSQMRLLIPLFLAVFSASGAFANEWPGNNKDNLNQPEVSGFFMANGIYDANDPGYSPPTANDFDEFIMGRDEVGKAVRRQQAVDFFWQQYGVDFSTGDSAQGGAIILLRNYADPRWNYRAYKLGSRPIPPSGLIIHDAVYTLAVVAPQATLYGSWGGEGGTVVDGGTVAVDGEYLIQGTNDFQLGHPKNIYMRFQSAGPIFNAFSGAFQFNCRLQQKYFGDGLAVGRQEFYQLADGMTQVSIVNVWQFPTTQWALEEDETLLP